MKRIEFDEKCKICNGTGLYSGMGEDPNCAVVCHTCNGTGCHHFVHEYDDFEGKILSDKIKHVYEVNPGIKVGGGGGYEFSDFGGMPYSDWIQNKPFIPGMENRRFTCPAWWYQSADYEKKPRWPECIGVGSFSGCEQFDHKEKCWDRWDKENT